MPDREKDIRQFQRAAAQRLAAAKFLLEHGFYLDSMYLAGYGVECALKSLILRRTPRGEHAQTWKELTEAGAKGHDFDYLKNHLKKRLRKQHAKDREVFGRIHELLTVVITWSTDLRYQVGHMDFEEARDFFEAANEIEDWCKRSGG